MTNDRPIIEKIDYDANALKAFEQSMQNNTETPSNSLSKSDMFLTYPTVYVITGEKSKKFIAYVGETTNIISRTQQHLTRDPIERQDWREFKQAKFANLFIIGHEKFNKSLTLDIENRLMLYMSGNPNIGQLNNRRNNPQINYYTHEYLEGFTSQIWQDLHEREPEIFPDESVIKDNALFKASPFHKLTIEQIKAKEKIFDKVIDNFKRRKNSQTDEEAELILVSGEAGAGKTVLLSALFYELNNLRYQDSDIETDDAKVVDSLEDPLDCYLLVNHNEQMQVYNDIALKLNIQKKKDEKVLKPTSFINKAQKSDKAVDIVLIDEGHLLLTQGNQGYRGEDQLTDILEHAKLVILIFDEDQIIARTQYWENLRIDQMIDRSIKNDNYIYLENQMRIHSETKTVEWINTFVKDRKITNIPEDRLGYNIKVFDDSKSMYQAIIEKAQNRDNGISRMLATYDWDWKAPTKEKSAWYVEDGDFKLPWNYTDTKQPSSSKNNQSWAEQPKSLHEVGSTYTIQGFDLNYAGVIIGPSVKYRNGKVIYDVSAAKSDQMTKKRTLESGEKVDISDKLLQNQLNVLLKRGINGLYIHAVDKELQEMLQKAQNHELKE
ncbi:DUF2075 domain-containing protein [Aerococcus urinae]|uniref:DUF2075 domain-containing protein n=1 Tax=Aerococcus TaxID=1375 RepID=UPI0018A6DA56|nr:MULTISPECIES: DUF2075 domain-containing protein [Aerococcus]MCY3036224.1 DUF2075 domain-containing protein [Aerococcus sp. Group 2]MDK6520238.1 DUF2075 domain-containing protein [Aerococcus urinae]